MGSVTDLLEAFEQVNIKEMAFESCRRNSDQFVNAVKGQLWDGQKPDGSDITPSYLDDPYFKTRKQAEAYASWKQKIGKNPRRNKYAPNLYINGYFYSTIALRVDSQLTIESGWGEVATKYSDALGVSLENQQQIVSDVIEPEVQDEITRITGLRFN